MQDFTPKGAETSLNVFLSENPHLAGKNICIIKQVQSLCIYWYRSLKRVIQSVWRVTFGPNNDWPLAVCDFTTVNSSDVETNDVIHRTHVGESTRLHHDSRQKWYYLSDQRVEEVVVFRNTDTGTMQEPRR